MAGVLLALVAWPERLTFVSDEPIHRDRWNAMLQQVNRSPRMFHLTPEDGAQLCAERGWGQGIEADLFMTPSFFIRESGFDVAIDIIRDVFDG